MLAALAAPSCSGDDYARPAKGGTVAVFGVMLDATRAVHDYSVDDYFSLGEGYGSVSIAYSGGTVTYNYSDGLLRAAASHDRIVFPDDGSELGGLFVFNWPADAVRAFLREVKQDQSARADFMSMDNLRGEVSDIMPSGLIPVRLYHTRIKITFELTGQYGGRRLESLEVGEYKAYCDPALKTAQLMYDPVHDTGSLPKGTPGYAKIEGVTDPVKLMIVESPDDVILLPGENFSIMLNL